MRFKTETKNRIQALKYRDGLENHQIAREMGISQTMIWQYIQGLEKQIEKGEITVADIVKSVNALKIEGPKKKLKKDEAEQQVDEMIAEQGMTQQELSENVHALDEALSKAGEVDVMSQGGIIKEPDSGKEKTVPIKKNYGGRPKMVVEVDGEPMNSKKPTKQSDYILSIMGHIYDELVAPEGSHSNTISWKMGCMNCSLWRRRNDNNQRSGKRAEDAESPAVGAGDKIGLR